jgi:hypothetical protein
LLCPCVETQKHAEAAVLAGLLCRLQFASYNTRRKLVLIVSVRVRVLL